MKLPLHINGGAWKSSHVQGIAIDAARKYMYFSFTTIFVKADLDGNIIGTVTGLTGHLGCIAYNYDDGRVYGSLEYKAKRAFYAAIFDVDKIDRPDMDAERDGIMTTVYLKEVVEDFTADMDGNGIFDGDKADTPDHRYGCSGIDGTTFGPPFGEGREAPKMLMIAYGIYGNIGRGDNDYQIIVRYDWRALKKYERPLSQDNPHTSGPDKPDAKYFIFTGNTVFGVQNLEYDDETGWYFMPVYSGKKPQYPNYPMYICDSASKPVMSELKGVTPAEAALCVPLLKMGLYDEKSGVYGSGFAYGQTGMAALGEGLFYFSHNGKTEDGRQTSDVYLYKREGVDFKLCK